MLLNVIFSFNRAMQLDLLLRSTLDQFHTDYEIVVVYHTTGEHSKGYRRLQEDYRGMPIEFVERGPRSPAMDSIDRAKGLAYRMLGKKRSGPAGVRDNFKTLLEEMLAQSPCEVVMFNTDDGVWIDEFELDGQVSRLIRDNPTTVSYRNYVGENIAGFPEYVQRWGDHCLWDYYADERITHWSYPFAVDGTVYSTKGILEVIRSVDYWNPVTLEGNVVAHVMRNRQLGIGLSPTKSRLVGTTLNRVAVETRNASIHIEPDTLNERFLQGYKLELKLPSPIDKASVVPEAVYVRRGVETILVYEIDAVGREVQSRLTEGGSTPADL